MYRLSKIYKIQTFSFYFLSHYIFIFAFYEHA